MARTGRNSFTPNILNRSFRWRWVVRLLMLQPLFHQTKNSWYHWIWGWVGPWTSLNVLYKWKIFWTYKEFDPDFLAHNLITILHIHISTVLMYFFGCWIGQHVGKNQKRFWEQLQNGKGHRLTVFWSALCRVRCFFPSFTVPTNTMMKVDGWPPKSILELIWKVTEGNWNV